MKIIRDRAPRRDGANRVLLAMLPGATDAPEDFLRHGFVRALRERRLPVDAILVDAHADYYLERSIGRRLATDVIGPARAGKYRQIWLMGISLGGMGTLVCARDHPAEIDGVILLAPYLGNRGRIAEIVRRGGFNDWQSGKIEPQDDEQTLLAWLKAYRSDDPAVPAIYLGYGTADRFFPASEMLAQRLAAERVVAMQGGHDWETWMRLWAHFLDRGLFSESAHPDGPRVKTAANQ
jgi:pimeloyl-ACP methyl ester carboxylesterase